MRDEPCGKPDCTCCTWWREKAQEAREIQDLDIIQVRSGDILFIRSKRSLDSHGAQRMFRQIEHWRKTIRAKIDVVVMSNEMEMMVARADKGEHRYGQDRASSP